MLFVQVIDRDGAIRYVPVKDASNRGAATEAVIPFLSPGERIGTVAGRNFFEGQGINLPSDDTAITAAPFDPGETGPMTNWQQQQFAKQQAAGGGGDAGGTSSIGTEEFGDFRPAFEAGLRERGIGIGPGGGVQGQLADAAFQNLRSRGFLDLALNAPAGQFGADAFADPNAPTSAELQAAAGPTFQEFARTRGLYGGAGAGDALNLFKKAVALSKGRLPGFGEADEFGTRANRFTDVDTGTHSDSLAAATIRNPLTGAFLNPAQGGQAAEDLARVAREAGRSRFGFASGFLPSAQQLSTSYFAQPQAEGMNFADFLNRRIFGT